MGAFVVGAVCLVCGAVAGAVVEYKWFPVLKVVEYVYSLYDQYKGKF